MSQLDDAIAKIPKPILVFIVLFLTLIFIIQQNPLSDGCAVENENFISNTKGFLFANTDKNKRVHYPQIKFLKDRCINGNSQGACMDYFRGLKRVVDALKVTSEKCYSKILLESPQVLITIKEGLKIMALVAWGDKPPESSSQRLGWLTEGDIYTFCRLKNAILKLITNEEYIAFRNNVYLEFPDQWSETIPLEKRADMPRPRAFKSNINPKGTMIDKEIYERSLFSLRCDLYQ